MRKRESVSRRANHKGTTEDPLINADSEIQQPVTVNGQQSRKFKHSKTKLLNAMSWGRRSYRSSPADTASSSPSYIAQTDTTVASLESTLTSASSLPQSLQGEDPQRAADHQTSATERLQVAANLAIKARWIGRRKDFVAHLGDIQTSLNCITTMVKLRALADIRKISMVPVFNGTIPDDIASTQDSLQRLHFALVELNKGEKSSSNHNSLVMSIRALKAAGYVQTKRKVQLDHDYLPFRENSAVYPLQVDSANEKAGTMILAETTLASSISCAQPNSLSMKISLSKLLCDIDEDAEHSLTAIGSILTPGSSTDAHELFQDISTSWILQDTLEGLVKRTKKYRTYIDLAVQIAISYMHFVSIARSHFYPGLSDYRYYKPLSGERKDVGPEHVLMPFLSVGFGSKAPKKGTAEIGGFESQAIHEDEALIRLGLVLHQVGRWTVFHEMDLETARRTAKSKRDDLIFETGMPFTQVVDLCLGSKDEGFDPLAKAKKIYGTVIVPLQKIVDELNWD